MTETLIVRASMEVDSSMNRIQQFAWPLSSAGMICNRTAQRRSELARVWGTPQFFVPEALEELPQWITCQPSWQQGDEVGQREEEVQPWFWRSSPKSPGSSGADCEVSGSVRRPTQVHSPPESTATRNDSPRPVQSVVSCRQWPTLGQIFGQFQFWPNQPSVAKLIRIGVSMF